MFDFKPGQSIQEQTQTGEEENRLEFWQISKAVRFWTSTEENVTEMVSETENLFVPLNAGKIKNKLPAFVASFFQEEQKLMSFMLNIGQCCANRAALHATTCVPDDGSDKKSWPSLAQVWKEKQKVYEGIRRGF